MHLLTHLKYANNVDKLKLVKISNNCLHYGLLQGALKVLDVKLQDVKQTDEISGHQNDGHENAGH